MRTLKWTPADHAAGGDLAAFVAGRPPSRPLTLTVQDLFRLVFFGLAEAESGVIFAGYRATGSIPSVDPMNPSLPGGPLPAGQWGAPSAFPRSVGGRASVARSAPVRAMYGESVLMAYQALQHTGRRVVRATAIRRDLPPISWSSGGLPAVQMGPSTIGNEEPAPAPILGFTDGAIEAKSIAPAVAVLVGVLGVAALAAAGYVGGEYAQGVAAAESEKARVHAELSLKQAALNAQIAAGVVPSLDAATISAGRAEERNGVVLPLLFGGLVVGLGAAAAWRLQEKRPRQ